MICYLDMQYLFHILYSFNYWRKRCFRTYDFLSCCKMSVPFTVFQFSLTSRMLYLSNNVPNIKNYVLEWDRQIDRQINFIDYIREIIVSQQHRLPMWVLIKALNVQIVITSHMLRLMSEQLVYFMLFIVAVTTHIHRHFGQKEAS